MKYLPSIIKLQYVKDYLVTIKFDNGEVKTVDISQYFKGPVFEPIKKKSEFKKFFLDSGTIAWPCGLDLAPDALYLAADVDEKNAA